MRKKCLMMLCLSMMVVFSTSCADSGRTRPEEATTASGDSPNDTKNGSEPPKQDSGPEPPPAATKAAGGDKKAEKDADKLPAVATGEDKGKKDKEATSYSSGSPKEESFLDLLSGPEETSLNIRAQRKLRVTITNKDNHSFSWQVPGYYEGNKTFSYEKLRIVSTQKVADMQDFRKYFALLYGIPVDRIEVEGTDLLIKDFDAEIFLKAILAMKYSTAIKDVVFGTVVPKVTPPGQ